jgi:hypothetical protein
MKSGTEMEYNIDKFVLFSVLMNPRKIRIIVFATFHEKCHSNATIIKLYASCKKKKDL